MRFRTTLVAALILALVGTYVYVFEHKRAKEREEQEDLAKKAFSGDWERLAGLRLTGSLGSFFLRRNMEAADADGGKGLSETDWRIVEPVSVDADDSAVDGMVRAMRNLDVERVVVEGTEDLAPFGLKKPLMRIEVLFEGSTDALPALLVGDKSPVGENSYAMREGENKVLLLSANMKNEFEKGLYDLREKRLFRFDREKMEKLEIFRNGRPSLEMVREGDRWDLVRPIHARASESEVENLIDLLTNLRAQSFQGEAPEDLNRFGLSRPRSEVFVTLKPDHARASLQVGRERSVQGRDLVYAKRGEFPEVVSLDASFVKAIDVDPESLREKEPVTSENEGKEVAGQGE